MPKTQYPSNGCLFYRLDFLTLVWNCVPFKGWICVTILIMGSKDHGWMWLDQWQRGINNSQHKSHKRTNFVWTFEGIKHGSSIQPNVSLHRILHYSLDQYGKNDLDWFLTNDRVKCLPCLGVLNILKIIILIIYAVCVFFSILQICVWTIPLLWKNSYRPLW